MRSGLIIASVTAVTVIGTALAGFDPVWSNGAPGRGDPTVAQRVDGTRIVGLKSITDSESVIAYLKVTRQ